MGYYVDSAEHVGVKITLSGTVSFTGTCGRCGNDFNHKVVVEEDVSNGGVEAVSFDEFHCPCGGTTVNATNGQVREDGHGVPTEKWQARYAEATQ